MTNELAQHCRQSGIKNETVLNAIESVTRSDFLPADLVDSADVDQAMPIGHQQTISQPFVVARMTELLMDNHRMQNVLEIGTGSGYQAAILSQCVNQVYSIERIKPLYLDVQQRLQQLGYDHIQLRFADGISGWQEHAPFDGIIITAATASVPPALINQLSDAGRMVLPLGTPGVSQRLCVINKNQDTLTTSYHDPVVFVPLLPGQTDT